MAGLTPENTPGINFALLFGQINMPRCSIGDNSLGGNALYRRVGFSGTQMTQMGEWLNNTPDRPAAKVLTTLEPA